MKIKDKLILVLSFGLIPLTSCNRDIVKTGHFINDEIRFGSIGIKVETKSFVETTDALLQTNGFRVSAVIDADNSVMFNKPVTYDINSSSYSIPGEHYFFPEKGTMSFYGVYPSSESIDIDAGNEVNVVYTHNADEDLVVAKAVTVAKQSSPVIMDFEHILSQVTMTARTDNANSTCKIYGITVTAADGGTYNFNDGEWTPVSTSDEFVFFASADGQAVTTTAKTVGSAMSFMPGTARLNIKWKCFNKIGSQQLSDNDQTIEVEIVKGKHSTFNLTLPSNSSEIAFATSVGPWQEDNQEIVVVPPYTPELLPGVFTVNDSGKKVKFAKGNLYWNGTEFRCEEHQYDSPATWDPNHIGNFFWSKDATIAIAETYSDNEITTEDKFFAADGGAIDGLTVLSNTEWQYLIDNSLHTDICETKKYYTDEDFGNGIFSYVGTYEEAKAAFEASEAVQENYPGVNFNEFLMDHGADKKTFLRNIAGVCCVILKPDGYSGEIKEGYTAAEWTEAEKSGLVALPFHGLRNDTGINRFCYCIYWSSMLSGMDESMAYHAGFYEHTMDNPGNRSYGFPVRLVSVQ